MAVSDIEAVLEFLRSNGLSESESALMEDVLEKSEFRSFDFEKFVFPMVPPPPPLKIPTSCRRPSQDTLSAADAVGSGHVSSEDEFVSLGSSTSDVCSSEFTNPYGIRTATGPSSDVSSDRQSQFGTARDYQDFDMQNDLSWYAEKAEDYPMPPSFGNSDPFGGPSEDKFVMTEKQLGFNPTSDEFRPLETSNFGEKLWPLNVATTVANNNVREGIEVGDFHNLNDNCEGGFEKNTGDYSSNGCSATFCVCCAGGGEACGVDHSDYDLVNIKRTNDCQYVSRAERSRECQSSQKHDDHNGYCDYTPSKRNPDCDWIGDFKSPFQARSLDKDFFPDGSDNRTTPNDRQVIGEPPVLEAAANEQADTSADDLILDSNEDDYEVFNLRIIHRKNRTGFEENKDFPIVLNSIVAGRYYVTEYLGSAAFSKVVQAHDLLMGTDVCLKIIKNDKDFFDQSLDEIKLLKFVNRHDPGDECHILRLYDYFYCQEHLFIVCELLRANLYEFQKYNRESGGEPYFTLSRLQSITRQCLEALEYMHGLGIIHCDLKPENILIKSYRRCEIKIIDLGSSCFQTDNLCLYVQSRSYRAPEVILGLPYCHKIDLWSLGCILAELHSGEVLFPNEAVATLLARMIGLLGPIDMEMLTTGQETHKYFTNEYDLYHMHEETNQLEYIIPEKSSIEHHLQVSDIVFMDFVRSLLEINPQRRPSAREALDHPWLCQAYDDQ